MQSAQASAVATAACRGLVARAIAPSRLGAGKIAAAHFQQAERGPGVGCFTSSFLGSICGMSSMGSTLAG
jgi:hypothetical protein